MALRSLHRTATVSYTHLDVYKRQAVADKVDAIIPIATTAAQVSAVATEDSRTPVVYAAISDPDTAKLTGIDYVTGTSDALNTEYILDMMLAQDPGVSKVRCV